MRSALNSRAKEQMFTWGAVFLFDCCSLLYMLIRCSPSTGPLGRHPMGGRGWEGFSPDPYLSGAAMDASVKGVQEAGAQACAKHFVGNEQETQRTRTVFTDGTTVEAVSSNIDDRTMHELYMWPFANAIKAGVASVMCSYSRVNQTYSCENSKMLNGLLKGELGFQGVSLRATCFRQDD